MNTASQPLRIFTVTRAGHRGYRTHGGGKFPVRRRVEPQAHRLAGLQPDRVGLGHEQPGPNLALDRDSRSAVQQPLYSPLKVIGIGGGSALDTGKAIAALLTNDGDPLDYICQEVAGYVREGFPAVKLKIGFGVEEDLALIEAVRETIGHRTGLMLDANHGFDCLEAIELGRRAAKLPKVSFQPPAAVIGRRTETCMESGVFYSSVDAIDGIVGAGTLAGARALRGG